MNDEEVRKVVRETGIFVILIGVMFVGDFVQSTFEVTEEKRILVHSVYACVVALALVIKVAVWWKSRRKSPPKSKIWE